MINARLPSAALAWADGLALGLPPATLLHPFSSPAALCSQLSLRLGVDRHRHLRACRTNRHVSCPPAA
jgi:hypothetical protein